MPSSSSPPGWQASTYPSACTAGGTPGSAFAGILGGIFAFGCPICNAVLVSLIGTSTILAYYLPIRPIIGLASVAILGVAVYLKARDRGCDTCAPESPAQDEVVPGAHSPDMSRG